MVEGFFDPCLHQTQFYSNSNSLVTGLLRYCGPFVGVETPQLLRHTANQDTSVCIYLDARLPLFYVAFKSPIGLWWTLQTPLNTLYDNYLFTSHCVNYFFFFPNLGLDQKPRLHVRTASYGKGGMSLEVDLCCPMESGSRIQSHPRRQVCGEILILKWTINRWVT